MPRWGGTGGELFYVHEQVLVAARVSLDPTFSVVERQELFSIADFTVTGVWHWNYSVADGGRRFLFRRSIGAESSSVILVANWLEELKAKVEN